MSATGFDPTRSRISADTLATYLAASIREELLDVPGVGDATKKILQSHDINTSWQLYSCYFRVCDVGMTSKERADAFWFYLQGMGVPGGTRSTIVQAIAEKSNILMPGIYEANDEEDNEVDNEE